MCGYLSTAGVADLIQVSIDFRTYWYESVWRFCRMGELSRYGIFVPAI